MAYVSNEYVAGVLGWPWASGNAIDATLTARIPLAESFIESYCGTDFAEVTGSEIYNSSGVENLMLRKHLTELTKIEFLDEDGAVIETLFSTAATNKSVIGKPTEKTLVPGLNAYTFLTRLDNQYWPIGKNRIKITGKWGFPTDNFPQQLKAAIAYTVQHISNLSRLNQLVLSENNAGATMTFNTDFLEKNPYPNIPSIAQKMAVHYRIHTDLDSCP